MLNFAGMAVGAADPGPRLVRMTAEQLISFARGAPSLDIVDVEGLKAAAVRAFDADPAGITAYGTSVGYPPLRKWIAEKHGVEVDQVLITNGSLAGRTPSSSTTWCGAATRWWSSVRRTTGRCSTCSRWAARSTV